ncbi:rhomboid family intramembrane serine protease [Macrococcus capreoli]|uniref:rhomboid family intramembrane serine protease n=1 Tax=Macrococcus capreoli TaxID=2982690 RepID=UPI003EE56042
MIVEKRVWKIIYEYIKYTSYNFFTISESRDDIWLYSREQQTLKRIILSKQTAQSTLFMVQKIMDHHDEIETTLGNPINHYELILIGQEVQLNEMPMNIKITSCTDAKTLSQALYTPFKAITNKTKPQSIAWYQKRIINQNQIDTAMIKFAPITYILILLNIMSFIFMSVWQITHKVDTIVEKGGLTHFNFVHGDYYRLISSIFMHFDFQHLLFNMMSLFILGKLVEFLFSKWQYVLIYIGGGIVGNLVSLTFDTQSISVGASGAICALLGALFAYLMFSGKYKKKFIFQVIVFSIIYLAMSALFANVNNYAHFGGLFGGLCIAILMYLFQQKNRFAKWLLCAFIILNVLLLFNIFSEEEHHIYNEYALKAMEDGRDQYAQDILNETVKKGYENDETYVYLGLLKSKEESLSNGIALWKKGLKAFPNSDKLNYQMALAMRALDDYESADKYLKKAIEHNKKQEYETLQKEIKEFR